MAKTIKQRRESVRVQVKESRQRDKDRAAFLQDMLSTAPEGIGKHVRIGMEVQDGELRVVWKLDDVGAAFVNEYADSIGAPAHLLLKELSIEVGRRLIRGAYETGGAA